MGRRIEIELTSARDDGSWTWRAAGAKQPKGDVDASLLYDGAKIGDVVKVEAEFHLDGIEVTEVFAPKAKKERTDLLELKTRPLRDDELVTTQRVAKGERRGGRGERGERGRSRGRGDDRGQRRGGGGGGGGGGGERRGPRPEAERRPRPKRLRPRRVHRDAMLAAVTEEHRPIVEQVIKDGMPGVRAAIEKQNAEAKEAGKPEIDATPILAIAEQNLSRARLAEWRDRADAALADAEELDIRDLRSVVVAGADVARDDESRAVADQIKTVLDARLESDHAAWLKDLDQAVSEGRVVRGLRLSSRPVKAGAPLPTEIASKLAQQASEALAADVMQDRWATVLDALAFSPVRGAVTPVGTPAEPSEELLVEVRRLSDRIPAIAALFGVDPSQVPKSAKRRRPPRRDQKSKPGGGRSAEPRKPRDASATRANARPVPGAEKPEPTEDKQQTPADQSTEAPSSEATSAPTNGHADQAQPEPEPSPDSSADSAAAPDSSAPTDNTAETDNPAVAQAFADGEPAADSAPIAGGASVPAATDAAETEAVTPEATETAETEAVTTAATNDVAETAEPVDHQTVADEDGQQLAKAKTEETAAAGD